MQRFLRENVVQQVFKLVVDILHVAVQKLCKVRVEMCYFSVLLFLHVLVQHSGEQRVVALAVRNVICTAEGVTQRMDCRTARRAECKSSHVGSGKEVAHVLRELVHALADQLLIASDYHFDSLVTHQLGVYGSFRGERGFNSVNQRVNGACAEHL